MDYGKQLSKSKFRDKLGLHVLSQNVFLFFYVLDYIKFDHLCFRKLNLIICVFKVS